VFAIVLCISDSSYLHVHATTRLAVPASVKHIAPGMCVSGGADTKVIASGGADVSC
jgi:hypothetical protein